MIAIIIAMVIVGIIGIVCFIGLLTAVQAFQRCDEDRWQ